MKKNYAELSKVRINVRYFRLCRHSSRWSCGLGYGTDYGQLKHQHW